MLLLRNAKLREKLLQKRKNELFDETREMEIQMLRLQDNIKEVAKKARILGIEQTKNGEWVIVYFSKQKRSWKIKIKDCESAYLGHWDFCMETIFTKNHTFHIADIKGPENRGYGSICMQYLKDMAIEENASLVTGDIAERDWDHLDRLVHFYQKNNFKVSVDEDHKCGELEWSPIYE